MSFLTSFCDLPQKEHDYRNQLQQFYVNAGYVNAKWEELKNTHVNGSVHSARNDLAALGNLMIATYCSAYGIDPNSTVRFNA